jgi:hypothetical protein
MVSALHSSTGLIDPYMSPHSQNPGLMLHPDSGSGVHPPASHAPVTSKTKPRENTPSALTFTGRKVNCVQFF